MRLQKHSSCTIDNCNGMGSTNKHGTVVFRKGYCTKHYVRYRKYGDPTFRKNKRGGVRHGLSRTPTWYSWVGMIERCTSDKYKQANDYKRRGIKVCDRWSQEDGFINFLKDMGTRPVGKTLDRIDNNGNYEPSNCRWATYTQQRLNQRRMQRDAR